MGLQAKGKNVDGSSLCQFKFVSFSLVIGPMFADALPQFSALDADSRLQLIEKLVFDLHWLMIGQWSHLQPLQFDFEQLFTTDPSPSVLGCQPTSTGHSKECRVRMSSSGKRRQREKSIKLKMWNQLQAVDPTHHRSRISH